MSDLFLNAPRVKEPGIENDQKNFEHKKFFLFVSI